MARVERTDEWVTAIPRPGLLRLIDSFLASENMRVTRLSEDSLYVSAGTHRGWRPLGLIGGFESYPCVGTIELAATEGGTRLSARVEEAYGSAYLDERSRRLYDASFAVWLQRFREAVPPADRASPSTVDVAHELAQLADLHAQGALTDAEFTAAKAALLSSERDGGRD